MKSRSADFEEAFENLQCNYDYTKQEMLVITKAYALYNSDISSGKSLDDSGWLDASYDIAPGIFHTPLQLVVIKDLRDKAPEYWEINDNNGRFRLSEMGRSFIKEYPNLVESAKWILCGVSHVRRV